MKRVKKETCRYTGEPLDECKCGGCDPRTIVSGEWVQPIKKGYTMECCDCGLAHVMDFRIYKGKIQFRAFRKKYDEAR